MKKIFFLVSMTLCLNVLTTIAQTIVHGGNVSGIWSTGGSPYNIQGSIQIPNDSTLTIQPGVIVNFQGTYKLNVQGRLLAVGNVTDTIIFTAANTTNGWRGIRFNNISSSNDTSRIMFCRIEYGRATGSSPDNDGGGLFFKNFSKTVVTHSLVTNCSANEYGGGIFISSGDPVINNNTISNNNLLSMGIFKGCGIFITSCNSFITNNIITNNSAPNNSCDGGGIFVESGDPTISNNTISKNNSYGYGKGGGICINSGNAFVINNIISNNNASNGAGIQVDGSNPTIINNSISDNVAQNVGGGIETYSNITIANNIIFNNIAASAGGGIECYTESATIKNNFICNNTVNPTTWDYVGGGGIWCVNCSSSTDISDNVITNNSASNGAGLLCYNASPTFTNNVIANNSASNNGGALSCSEGSPVFQNCIIYGNTALSTGSQVYLFDEPSDPSFYYCNVQDGSAAFELNGNFYTGIYQNNINADPLFVSPSGDSGTGFDGLSADWSLQSSSLCIDNGDPSGTYPATDIIGNPRVNVCRIDIGAYEFQTGIPFTASLNILQPILCNGAATGEITVVASGGTPPYTYLWSNGNTTASISGLVANTYSVVVSGGSYGCTLTKSITLTQPVAISIDAGTDKTIIYGGTIPLDSITSNYTGTGTLTYNWLPSSGLNNNTIPNPIATATTNTTYIVTVTTPNGCSATDDISVYINPLPAVEICYVEFDTTTSKNNIKWAPNLSANIDSIHIYNEVSTNVWSLIGSVSASQNNFIDINSNPFTQSYSYKISAKDAYGQETNTSAFHRTITLLSAYNQGTDTYGFTWSAYQGINIANYYLYGITATGIETLIGSVPGNQYFYNYINPDPVFVKYFIGFNTPTCNSKTNHLVKSNSVKSPTTGLAEMNLLVSFYPNPVLDNLLLKTVLVIKNIEIADITGRLLLSTKSKIIDCSSFAKGVYFISVTTEKGIIKNKFVKQ